MSKINFTAAELKKIIEYDPETGTFLRLVNSRRRKNMKVSAGSIGKFGHRAIRVYGSVFQAHRLAWLYVYEEWPDGDIDHLNGNPDDNRIINLRVATKLLNAQNRRRQITGKITPLGVTYAHHNPLKPYCARISDKGASLFLGYFVTEESASTAYIDAKRRLHQGCTI